MNTLFYLTCILALVFTTVAQDIGCYVEGSCSGGPLVGFSYEIDSIDCHVECLDTAACAYWTYYLNDATCLLYSETCHLTIEDSTLSGEVSY